MKNVIKNISTLIEEGEAFNFQNYSSHLRRKDYGTFGGPDSPKWLTWKTRVKNIIEEVTEVNSAPNTMIREAFSIELEGNTEEEFERKRSLLLSSLTESLNVLKHDQFDELYKKKSSNKKMNNKTLRAFISYSTDNKEFGIKVKNILDEFNIDSFLAHDDIKISEIWKERIRKELNSTDIFILILSKEFKSSNWTSQEIGIAFNRDVLIIPLSLDGTISYGFIEHIQSKKMVGGIIPISYIMKPIMKEYSDLVLNDVINLLATINNFRSAEDIMELIVPCYNHMTNEQINGFVKASIENGQIWSAKKCRTEYLPKFIIDNKEKIDIKQLEILKYQIENNEFYRTAK